MQTLTSSLRSYARSWAVPEAVNPLSTCQYCGTDEEFLLIHKPVRGSSRWLCSSCYSNTLSTKSHTQRYAG
ncbi:MAG: hypothetical protein HOB84_15115 [Candidatus Marinimicrobia bacterium]|nr:hypothetical protein [Candidatus Neomarinimicrobiota bacterium]MBT4036376.1 hypothetical protein [Candidatus Neomarinimicrobiota bacterium]MBT4361265.1 hypothetical protein [Candidatus Neomarinimicrobiota bacterium]MBT4716098.1 hypothetical protein [Candidatus Neomarinimicrobiota bacterium]MBT4945230.1 hypothetical protein [Candidatus Neomarinimicrobiota bacterium]